MKKMLWASTLVLTLASGGSFASDRNLKTKIFIQGVRDNHPAFERFQASEKKAEAMASSMRAYLYNPEFSFTGETRDTSDETRLYELSQTVDITGKNLVKKRVGQYLALSKKAEISIERSYYIANLIKAIAEYESANKVVKLAIEQAHLMDKFVEIGERRSQAGDVGSTELALARLAGAQAQSVLADATASFETAKATLNKSCDCRSKTVPLLEVAPPTLTFPENFESLAMTLPRYYAAQTADEAAKQNVSLKKRQKMPDPTFNIGTGFEGRYDLVTFGLSIPIPVLNTGAPEVREAKAEALEVNAKFHEMRTSLLADLKSKSKVYQGHQKALLSWRKLAQPSLNDYTKALEKQWNAGELSASNYLVQVKQGIETAMTGASIKSHAWGAWADYMALTGQIESWSTPIHTKFKEVK